MYYFVALAAFALGVGCQSGGPKASDDSVIFETEHRRSVISVSDYGVVDPRAHNQASPLTQKVVPLIAKKNWQEADTELRKFLKNEPYNHHGFILMAVVQLGFGNINMAEFYCNEVLNQFPDDPFALNLMGILIQERSTQPASILRAAAYFEQALHVKPKMLSAGLNLGSLLLQSRRYETAAERFDSVLEYFPKNLDAQIGKAITLLRLGETELAQDYLEDIVSGADHPLAQYYLALIYRDMGTDSSTDRAFRLLSRVVKNTESTNPQLFQRARTVLSSPDFIDQL